MVGHPGGRDRPAAVIDRRDRTGAPGDRAASTGEPRCAADSAPRRATGSPATTTTHRSPLGAPRYRNVGSAPGISDQRLRRRTRVAYVVTERSAGSPAASLERVITTVRASAALTA